ncbi:uncharacterized protein LOC123500962 isoform X2 [Portunus trituberculatus]|uniref:uncharacterized protein LOC123500962 isoform X2 n=1 Tax=Portunus trituberculatus TaxID=210409 RepID=UPI001E1D06D2|nr:uncharacterized protein LOC123500962 isoform X2 [Portunus trituberculatus]
MGPGTAVLRHALKCGTNKAPSVTLLDHMASLPDSSTANYRHLNNDRRRRAFTSEERRKLVNDPSCQTFDITLLYKSITLACERVAPLNDDARWKDPALMEGRLNKIKSERNVCVHEWSQTIIDEDQFKNKVEELEEDFETALELVRDRYGVCARETNILIETMKVQIQDVIQAFTERVILKMTFEKKLALFKEVTPGHLKDRYRHFESFDPLSFLLGSKERVYIQTVYIKLVLRQENTPLDIESSQLLRVLREECQPFPPVQDDRPRLAVVSGIAGSGKTTLLTFMVSEWRREECDRRVKHLEEYDIVLRILCRDKHAEDLETFLRRILPPSLSVFGEPLVNYLERCKVLFLIDGLDEMNQTSEKLVTNVMTLARCNKQFSILVTSRQERVDWLLGSYEQDYRISHLSIEGIHVAKRMEFALKYSTSSTNEEKLREFMAQHQDTELFELPLNLLFLVTLFEDNPDSIKNHITQASLYTYFHEWCTEKLRVRIATYPTYGQTRPRTLKTRIKRVLKEMYQMALQGLLQDRLTLSEEDTERLEKRCKEEELPEQDVLGAFYTLRLFVNNRVREEQYSLPHKGLLEYFAARHIIQRLQDESLPLPGAGRSLTHTSTQQKSHRPRPRLQDRVLSLINPIRSLFRKATQPKTPGAIRSVLHTVTQQGTFCGQRNLFFHVAGLLAREKVPNRPEAIKEVIELVAETGARWKEWLSLVEHTDYNESFLRAIAHHVSENPPVGTVRITDSTLASAAALLPRTPPTTTVELRLDREKVMVKDTLHRALTHHYCSDLSLHHHYEQPGNIPASDIVLRAIHSSNHFIEEQ